MKTSKSAYIAVAMSAITHQILAATAAPGSLKNADARTSSKLFRRAPDAERIKKAEAKRERRRHRNLKNMRSKP